MEFLADTSPTIAWPSQLLSQSLWLYYHYQWCNFMNHLFRSLNGIFISPGFMIHLNICGNIDNVIYYWNHVSYDIVASSFSWTKCGGTFWHTYGHIWWKPRMSVFWIFDILDEEGLSAKNCLLSLRMFPLYSGEPPGGHLQSSHTNQLLSLSKQSNNYKIAFGFYAVLWCFFKKVGIEALLDDNYNFYDNIGRVHSWILTFVIFRCASILIHPHVSILLQPYGQ